MAWELSGIPDGTSGEPGIARVAMAASTYHRYFDDVHDLSSRLTDSPAEAAAITRSASTRLVEGRLVRASGSDGGRFVATAYHEAAATADRATQPVAAGTHTLPPGLVDAVNTHVRRCSACRRWGPLQYAEAPAPPRPDRALRAHIWNDVAPPTVEQVRTTHTPPPAPPPLEAYRARTVPGRRWRWLVAGAAAAIALAAIAIAALVTSDGGRKGRSDLSAFASGEDHATVTATSRAGAATPTVANTTNDGSAPTDASTESTPTGNSGGGSTSGAPPTTSGDAPATSGDAGSGNTNSSPADQRGDGTGESGGSGANGNQGAGSPSDGGGNNGGAVAPPTPAPQQPTPVTQPPPTSTPAPAPTPPPAPTATTPPPPLPTPTEPPAPEPTTIIDQLPVVPTVIDAVPTILPLLGGG